MLVDTRGHVLAAVDLETTGLDSTFHEIIQIAVVPYTADLEPLAEPFVAWLVPDRPERWSPEAQEVHGLSIDDLRRDGHAPAQVEQWLVEYVRRLCPAEGQKLLPLAHNWAFESSFLDAWLGGALKNQLFHYHARDSMTVAGFLRDRGLLGLRDADSSLSLDSLGRRLGVTNDRPHDALHDAIACANVYRLLVT